MERYLRAKGDTACDREEARGRIHADRPAARCNRSPKTARHRIDRQLVRRICKHLGFRYRALDRSRQGRQYQDGAVTLRRSRETPREYEGHYSAACPSCEITYAYRRALHDCGKEAPHRSRKMDWTPRPARRQTAARVSQIHPSDASVAAA